MQTVTAKSDRQCLAKTSNKLNRLYGEVDAMVAELQQEIEDLKVRADPKDAKEQARYLADTYGYESSEVGPKRLWAFGPDGNGPNWLVDGTRGVAYLNEIQESINAGFQIATRKGPLCDEPVRVPTPCHANCDWAVVVTLRVLRLCGLLSLAVPWCGVEAAGRDNPRGQRAPRHRSDHGAPSVPRHPLSRLRADL